MSCALRNSTFGLQLRVISRQYTIQYITENPSRFVCSEEALKTIAKNNDKLSQLMKKKNSRRGIKFDPKFRIRRIEASPSCAQPKQSYSAVTL